MAADWTFIGVEVVVGLIAFVALMTFAIRRGQESSPTGIVKRLRTAGGPLEVKVGARRATWDPSRTAAQGMMRWGRARATYTLGENDTVHLRYEPQGGEVEELDGPIPENNERAAKVMRRMLVGYATGMSVAFVVGLLVSHGPWGERLVWGFVGIAAALMVAWVVGLVLGVGKAIRDVGRQSRTPPTW